MPHVFNILSQGGAQKTQPKLSRRDIKRVLAEFYGPGHRFARKRT